MINFVLVNFNIYASKIVPQMGHEEIFFFFFNVLDFLEKINKKGLRKNWNS